MKATICDDESVLGHGLVTSFTLRGLRAIEVPIRIGDRKGVSPFVVGLPDPAARESCARIRIALESAGFEDVGRSPPAVLVGPIPDIKMPPFSFAQLDLAIALALLIDAGHVEADAVDGVLVGGEIGLDGTARPVRGALPAAILAADLEMGLMLSSGQSADEAAALGGTVYPVTGVADAVDALGARGLRLARPPKQPKIEMAADMSEMRGQQQLVADVEKAVAARQNILLIGPPGVGKTMVARRIPTILPALSRSQQIETSIRYSMLGMLGGQLICRPPFRAPHHTVSVAAMAGGGRAWRPGEIALAKHGVLFLDDLPEFAPRVLEPLRHPGEFGGSNVMLVSSALPCPCGWHGSDVRACVCSGAAIARYMARLERLEHLFDVSILVGNVTLTQVRHGEPCEDSATIRARICRTQAGG